MNPEHHVKRFLEEANGKYTFNAFRRVKRSLRYYVDFLKFQGEETIDVGPEVIHKFCALLYYGYAHEPGSASNYIRAIKHFYNYLVHMRTVRENPVKPYSFCSLTLKDRSYTDPEIIRAYIENWRKLIKKPSKLTLDSYRYLEKIFKKLSIKLQTLNASDLLQVASGIDILRTQQGKLLKIHSRKGTLSVLESILRWMQHNGYRKDNPAKCFYYQFLIEDKEALNSSQSEIKHSIWEEYSKRFLQDTLIRCRPSTVKNWRHHLKDFVAYLGGRSLTDPNQINQEVLETYQAKLYVKENLSDSTKWSRSSVVRYFMNWLEKTDQILVNPVHKMTWPKKVSGLPTRLMSAHDVNSLMSMADIRTPVGLRNRTIFELMYSTGVRVGEAASIIVEDIDFENGLLKVTNPKGGLEYQRVVPIGQIALQWVRRYLQEAREDFPRRRGYERHLFLTKTGGAINQMVVCGAMRQYALKAGMRKIYSSHSWRVTCATAMLRNRADIRHVQEQLGHRSLQSTQIYTRLFPMDLKKVHQKTHPREKEIKKEVKKFINLTLAR